MGHDGLARSIGSAGVPLVSIAGNEVETMCCFTCNEVKLNLLSNGLHLMLNSIFSCCLNIQWAEQQGLQNLQMTAALHSIKYACEDAMVNFWTVAGDMFCMPGTSVKCYVILKSVFVRWEGHAIPVRGLLHMFPPPTVSCYVFICFHVSSHWVPCYCRCFACLELKCLKVSWNEIQLTRVISVVPEALRWPENERFSTCNTPTATRGFEGNLALQGDFC